MQATRKNGDNLMLAVGMPSTNGIGKWNPQREDLTEGFTNEFVK